MTLDQQFNALNDKLQQLLKQHTRLQKEAQRLREELVSAKNKETETQQKVEELQQQISVLKYASGELNEKDKKAFERKINQYIKEIDRCVSFLSQ
jgi:chromosome segregation ATPase